MRKPSLPVPSWRALALFSARTEILFYALLWLMVLVVVGTIAQRYIGLYQAQQLYFSSFIFKLGFVPLPGGYLTMAVISYSLSARLIFSSKWDLQHLGINITHLGALLLLFGGFLTAAFSSEGNMVIPEGSGSNVISDYHQLELALIDDSPAAFNETTVFAQGWLKNGKILRAEALPFDLEVVRACRNCEIVQRSKQPLGKYHGMAARFDLIPSPLNKEAEQNRAGLMLALKGTQTSADGIYALLEYMPVPQTLQFKGKNFTLELRRARTRLPFSIELIDFEKRLYPGTGMAKSYRSIVTLVDESVRERRIIQMNEPLRYQNYTFYQSSFIEGGAKETTVLAVVKNAGRIFPYLSSLIMCIGLLIHLLLQVPKLTGGKP